MVDLATGTGQFSIPAALRFARVIAVDISPAMLVHLRAKADRLGRTGLEVVRAGFLGYEHQGSPADGVYTRHGPHQLPDFWKALALDRIAAILRPGGILRLRDLIYDFGPGEARDVFRAWLAGAATDGASGYTADDYLTHIRTEHSTFRWLFEPMLDAAGFRHPGRHLRSRAVRYVHLPPPPVGNTRIRSIMMWRGSSRVPMGP